ncbi:MAG TPA: glucan 1,4-alpha-glucosidase [Gemmatimonadales bacterium]
MTPPPAFAPGWPGIAPRWTSSDKSGVGTSLSADSRLWFTTSHGVVNEVYYPRIDRACVRDMGLIVTDGRGFASEEKRHTTHVIERPAPGTPAYRLTNRCVAGRYQIEKELLADPFRPALLQRIRFTTTPPLGGYRLHVLLAPHLSNRGSDNTAWVDEYKGVPMLFAQRDGTALALACTSGFRKRSVGFVGTSDGWQDIVEHNEMTWEYTRAENGNVAMMAEIALPADGAAFMLTLAFGGDPAEAGHRARAALHDGYDVAYAEYTRQWDAWQDSLLRLDDARESDPNDRYRISTIVMRTHESTGFPGGMIASLAVPWGFSKGDEDLGGYHLVWPRDLVETAGGLLAAGGTAEAARVLAYLQTTQEADGHWGQNMWLDGTPYWTGIQMDETALPILLVDLARRHGALAPADLPRFRHMVRRAAGYIMRNGPVSPEDRWEEDPGYSPFTVAAQIAALLVASDLAESDGAHDDATYLRETADTWHDCIDRWMYASGANRANRYEVDGYYVRIAPVDEDDAGVTRMQSKIPVRNVDVDHCTIAAAELISPDALALVRFGLRRADDARIVNTVHLIDAQLRVNTPAGPAWRRYNGDGYGEHADGSPFDGTGIGRAWPLLTGERAHYELAAGRVDEAHRLLRTMEAFTSEGGLLPEQIWDAPDIPERELFFGKPAGSAMPLVWAHAEYVKLARSLRDGRVFDLPPQTVQRYLEQETRAAHAIWRFNHKTHSMPAGKILRIETLAPAVIHWSADDWATASDIASRDTGFGMHVTDLPTTASPAGTTFRFTMHWSDVDSWEGTDFAVVVTSEDPT